MCEALRKIEAIGLGEVYRLAAPHKRGLALHTVYKWRAALRAQTGVLDAVKLLLITSTASCPDPLTWADFDPRAQAAEPERNAA